MVGLHLKKHGGSAAKSLAAIPAGRSTRESLAALGDPAIEHTLTQLASGSNDDADRTASYAVGTATADGQRFRILRPHARGGLGAVFVALDCELHREVALKQILEEHADDPAGRSRFLLEAEITGGLEHPGIVPVYGLGTFADGRPYYAVRFIRGDSLKEAADRFHADDSLRDDPGRRSLELRKLLRRFTDVCNAIDYAHSRGVLHRDLKPGNVIVGRYGETLVVDWGLAKATGRTEPGADSGERTLVPCSASGSAETLPGSALGTPAYMSPEQAEGDLEHLGPRSDVYSLGATLYYLLTGRPPLEGEIADVIRAVQRGEFPPPRQRDASIDRALEAVCLKAMAHRPSDRYATPKALSEDIERWMADEPVSAWREPFARRARRWAKRNRTAGTGAAVALIAGVIGLSAVLMVQTRAKADIARALDRETAANAELARSKAAVQARYDLAVAAIQTFHTGVSEEFLLKQERFKGLRENLLKAAIDFYGRLGALLEGETDRASRRALLSARFQVVELGGRVGRMGEALATHARVLADREALAGSATAGEKTDLLGDIASSHHVMADLYEALGRLGECRAAREACLRVRRELAEAHPDRPQLRRNLGAALGNMDLLDRQAGKTAEALSAREAAGRIFEELVRDHAQDTGFQSDLAINDYNRGLDLSALGRTAEALTALEAARGAFEKLTTTRPRDTLQQVFLAKVNAVIAGILWATGEPAAALQSIEAEERIYRKLVAAYPADTSFQSGLAQSQMDRGTVLRALGDPDGAMSAYEEALVIRRMLAEENPEVADFQRGLAAAMVDRGLLRSAIGRQSGALADYEASLAIFRKLVESNPDIAFDRRNIGRCLNSIGVVHHGEGRSREAIATFEESRAIHERLARDHPGVDEYRAGLAWAFVGLARAFRRTDRPAEAVRSYRRAIAIREQLPTMAPGSRFELAEDHAALAALADAPGSGLSAAAGPAEADRAMEVLRRTVALGFRPSRRLRTDPAFAPLRDRADFRLLVMDLEMPAEPFARGDIGDVRRATGEPAEAPRSSEAALAAAKRLAEAHPKVTPFQIDLARLLLQAGRPAEAERHLDRMIAAMPEEGPLYAQRGIVRAQLERWAEADADFVEATRRGTGVFAWYAHALLRLHLDDLAGYRTACEAIVERFEGSEQGYTLKQVSNTCSLAPEAVSDLARPLRLAEKALARDPKGHWSHEAPGRLLYRAGRHEEAVRRLEEAVALLKGEGNVWHWLYLAMAHRALGHTDEARRWLGTAEAWLAPELARPSGTGADRGALTWNQRLEARHLLREARLMIRGGDPQALPAQVSQGASERP
jgi:serine/threonine-protein kinase